MLEKSNLSSAKMINVRNTSFTHIQKQNIIFPNEIHTIKFEDYQSNSKDELKIVMNYNSKENKNSIKIKYYNSKLVLPQYCYKAKKIIFSKFGNIKSLNLTEFVNHYLQGN